MLATLSRYAAAVRPIALGRLVARGRRELRIRRLLAGRMRPPPLPPDPASCAARLRDPRFVAAARRQRELAQSAFAWNPVRQELQFLRSGDRVAPGEGAAIAWNRRDAIAAADVNRCHFIAFMEQAVLEDLAEPQAALGRVAAMVAALHASASRRGSFLAIPWQALPLARRLVNLLCFLSLCLDADSAIAEEPHFAALLSICAELDALVGYLREDDLGYNHLASQLCAQVLASHVFRTPVACAERVAAFVACVEAQVGADGMQRERSPTYQAHVLAHVRIVEAAAAFGAGAELVRLGFLSRAMRDALGVLTMPDGDIALFNDSAIGDGPSPQALGVTRRPAASALPQAGFYRMDGGGWALVFDAGRCGADDAPGHAHADFLSVQACAGGRRLVVDPGVASYAAGPQRAWTRGAATHNGPRFAGLEPMEMWGAFRVGRRGRAWKVAAAVDAAPLSCAGWQDGYDRAGGRVARWLGLWPDGVLRQVDLWLGGTSRDALSTFRIPCEWALAASGDGLTLTHPDGTRVRIGCTAGRLSVEARDRHYPFGPRAPQPAYVLALHPEEQPCGRVASLYWSLAPDDPASSTERMRVLEVARSLRMAVGNAAGDRRGFDAG